MSSPPRIERFDGTEYFFLSNFYPSPITYQGITYPTVEHAFQAMKTLDIQERERIAGLATPGLSKQAGRRVALRGDWEQIKIRVMRKMVTLKFQDPKLAGQLMATGDTELIEGNNWRDRFWGVTEDGIGQNWLGKILMHVREQLRDSEPKDS